MCLTLAEIFLFINRMIDVSFGSEGDIKGLSQVASKYGHVVGVCVSRWLINTFIKRIVLFSILENGKRSSFEPVDCEAPFLIGRS